MDSAEAYDMQARNFLAHRDQSPTGSKVVARWAAGLPEQASTIELGCGGGYPVTRELFNAGLRLWAVDASPTLCAIFEERFPTIPVRCARVQQCDFFNRRYQAVIAIGLIFLLPEPEQSALIGKIATLLEPAGRLLFTAPVEIGSWNDSNTAIPCHSPGRQRYEQMLTDAGFGQITTASDIGQNNYYDARLLLT